MKLQPNEMPDSLLFALRLTEVSRWGIVATSRQQSVGEHCYRVCMIALALYDYIEEVPHNSSDRAHVASLSMAHDVFEILTGDLDSVFKTAMKSKYPDVHDDVLKGMATGRRDSSDLYKEVSSVERATNGTIVEAVVKIADMIEALIYLDCYGTNHRHREHVRDNISERLWTKVEGYKKTLPRYDWNRVDRFVRLVLDTPGAPEQAKTSQDWEDSLQGAPEKVKGTDTSERFEAEYRG